MIEHLAGLHETVTYQKNLQVMLYDNDKVEDYPPHWHAPFELIMPTLNGYRAICNGKEYLMKEGDILIICPGVIHELFAPPKGVRIIFQPSQSQIALKEMDLIISMLSPAAFITPENAPEIHPTVHRLMLEIKEEFYEAPLYAASIIYAKFLEILVLAGRHHARRAQQNFEVQNNNKQKEYMEKFLYICDYINEHYADPLTLEEVASMAGFSKYHFTRLFKQYADTTFYKYLNQKRIAHAKSLLVNKELSVLEVALQCGFSNLSSFLRMFKIVTGWTPTELRRIYEGDGDYTD